jgi:predicted RNase H-like HicB family nuclease
MELTVVVHRERKGFWSEVPELPGCFASGRTLDELREALGESIGLYLYDAPAEVVGELPELGTIRVDVEAPAGRASSPG